MNESTLVRVRKASTESGGQPEVRTIAEHLHKNDDKQVEIPKVEPSAQLVEVQPGVYDVIITCSCGERWVARCEALEG